MKDELIQNSFPSKKWEDMPYDEQEYYRTLPKKIITSRWNTEEGQKIIEQVKLNGFQYGTHLEYSNFIGTVKIDYSKKPAKYDLRGIPFKNFSNLTDDEVFSFDFSNCSLLYSDFNGCSFSSSTFYNSDILYSDFSNSIFDDCDFSSTNLTLSNFSHSLLENANFKNTWMSDTNFKDSNLGYVKFNNKTTFYNFNVHCFEGTSSPLFINYIKRNHYLNHFKNQSFSNRIIYYIWLIVSDCGNSFSRWLFTSFAIIISFGLLFTNSKGEFIMNNSKKITSFTYYYYSIINFSTLGYGDITPNSLQSEVMVSIEVILGYIMLGGLISIFSNKFLPKI